MIGTVISLVVVVPLIGALVWLVCGPAGPPRVEPLTRRVEVEPKDGA